MPMPWIFVFFLMFPFFIVINSFFLLLFIPFSHLSESFLFFKFYYFSW